MNIPTIALVACCLQTWIPGPMAIELAVVAEARRALEDGPNRPADESVPGVGLDPAHTVMLNKVKTLFPNIRHDLVTGDAAAGGTMKLYRLKGDGAQIAGAVLVGLVLDSYPCRFGNNTESFLWNGYKRRSYSILDNFNSLSLSLHSSDTDQRTAIMKWADRLFGPHPPSGRK